MRAEYDTPNNATGYVAFADNNPGGGMPKPSGTATLSELTITVPSNLSWGSNNISPRNPPNPGSYYFVRNQVPQMLLPFINPGMVLSAIGVTQREPASYGSFLEVSAAQLDAFRSAIASALANPSAVATFVYEVVSPEGTWAGGSPALYFEWQQVAPQMQYLPESGPSSLVPVTTINQVFNNNADLATSFALFATQFFIDQRYPQLLTLSVLQNMPDQSAGPNQFISRAIATITLGYSVYSQQ